ncbi:hypothetical protein MUP77_09395 [Candidatus Bathyarchaeota archaeon]|nr:hypothetical protein [Candidatus Bathyarchaeota archaeon]
MSDDKYEVTGGTPLERCFVESYLCNKANNIDDLDHSLREYKHALTILPAAKDLIEQDAFGELLNYFGKVLKAAEVNTEVLENHLKCVEMIDKEIQDSRRRPMNRASPAYNTYCEELGFLEGKFVAAVNLTRAFSDLNTREDSKKVDAIKTLHSFVDNRMIWIEQQTVKLRQEIGMVILEKKVLRAIATKQEYIGIPTKGADGKKRVRMVPTSYFADESMTVEDLTPYFG